MNMGNAQKNVFWTVNDEINQNGSDEMADIEKVIKGLTECIADLDCDDCPYEDDCFDPDVDRQYGEQMMRDALELLKVQYDAMKPIDIRKWHDGYVGDCPSCGRVVRFAQRYCHNCTRLLDWAEVMEFPTEEDDDEVDDKTTASCEDGILYHHYCVKCGWDWWTDEAFPNRCSKCGCELN